MSDYRIRPATLDDIDVLVHHRVAMFSEMGMSIDADSVAKAFREWVTDLLPTAPIGDGWWKRPGAMSSRVGA